MLNLPEREDCRSDNDDDGGGEKCRWVSAAPSKYSLATLFNGQFWPNAK